jgi:hypothetical protein
MLMNTTTTYPWIRFATPEDIEKVDAALEQISFNTWSAQGHIDKYGRPIVIIGFKPEGFRPLPEQQLGITFIGPQGMQNSRMVRDHLESLCLARTGNKGSVWLPPVRKTA